MLDESTATPAPWSLLFGVYRVTGGVYPVYDSGGVRVADIKKHWTGTSFQVRDAVGAVLSTVDRGGMLSTRWNAVDAASDPLLVFKTFGPGGDVTFAGGREVRVRRRFFSNEWTVTDVDGRQVVSVAPTGSAWSLRRRPWLAQVSDNRLTWLDVIVLVETYRLDQERRRRRNGAVIVAVSSS